MLTFAVAAALTATPPPAEPEPPTQLRTEVFTSPRGMVVSTSLAAAWAGKVILEQGGNAVDARGNVVSLTQTLGEHYGAAVVATGMGFMYSSALQNFDLEDPRSTVYLRPRTPPHSTMAPTIVLRGDKPFLALGSVGSGRIASGVVSLISNVIDLGLSLDAALSASRALWSGDSQQKVFLEVVGEIDDNVANTLEARGFNDIFRVHFPVTAEEQASLRAAFPALLYSIFGATNPILVRADGQLLGAGDPRRQGIARPAARSR